MSAPFQTGETVDIIIRGARVNTCTARGLFINIPGGPDFGVSLPTDENGDPVDAVTVNRVHPVGGPVRAGDIWSDRLGMMWFARWHQNEWVGADDWGMTLATRQGNEGGPALVLTPLHAGPCGMADEDPVAVNREHGPLELVYRVPEPPAPEPDPVPGVDFLPPDEVTGDAEQVTDWSAYAECHACDAAAGQPCVYTMILNLAGQPRRTPCEGRRLVNVLHIRQIGSRLNICGEPGGEGATSPSSATCPECREAYNASGDSAAVLP